MKKVTSLIILFVFLLSVVGAIRPYWAKYWLEKDMEAAAIYGTKNSIGATRRFLDKRMRETGRDFEGEDFVIEKGANNTVYVSVPYDDRISILGVTLKELEFTAEATAREVKGQF